MEVIISTAAQKDLKYWAKSHNDVVMRRIEELFEDIIRHPYEGIGNPEPLKHSLSGFWSRRIIAEHRLVYRIDNNGDIEVASCRFHY